MPTNLPPEYFEAEKRYRAASTPAEKITLLEELIGTIPKHKGTDKLRADLRRKLSKLKDAAQAQKKKMGRQESVYHIDREGAGRVVLVGMPNVGKSSLVATLTNATPKVDAAPYTTWGPTPGMMFIGHVQIQLIDTPPLNKDHVEPELRELIRSADLLLIILDLQDYPIQQLEDTVEILKANRIEVYCGKEEPPALLENIFRPLIVVNKHDDAKLDEEFQTLCELYEEECSFLSISTATGRNVEEFKSAVFEALGLVRIYSKRPGKEPNLESPFVMKQGGTVEEFAGKVHKDFLHTLKSARVWGEGVFDGQQVGRDHVLHDGDVVELVV